MSRESPFKPEIEEFIYRNIDSVELLEVLLLLFRTPETRWTVNQINEQLRSNVSSISNRLEKLVKNGFVEVSASHETTYRYSPRPELRESVSTLAQIYSSFRLRVIEEIYRSSVNRMREFADAFRIRKEDGNG